MSKRLFTILSILLFAESSGPVNALEIANNLGETPNGISAISDSNWTAQMFSTTEAYVIDSISLPLRLDTNGMSGTFSVSIFSSDGTVGPVGQAPGSQIATLGDIPISLLSTTMTTWNFDTLNIPLQTFQLYYLVVSGTGISGGNLEWQFTSSHGGIGFPLNWSETTNSGTNWSTPISDGLQQMMRITAVVPEPSTLCLAAVGQIVMACTIRKKIGRKPPEPASSPKA